MKASSVDEKTSDDLKQWLETPRNGSEAGLGIDVQQDLAWAQNSKDLSSISLKKNKAPSTREIPTENRTPSIKNEGGASIGGNGSGGGGGGGGAAAGFLALFGCASKRK